MILYNGGAVTKHLNLEYQNAEKFLIKARQYLCKEARLSVYLREADPDTLDYRFNMKNDGCRNPRMHGSSRCATCTLAHRAAV